MRLLFALCLRGEEHEHEPPFELGVLFHVGDFGAALRELDEQLFTDVGVGHFAAAEADGDLDPVALLQELAGALHFGVEVVGVDAGGHANLFDLYNALVFTVFLVLLHLIEAEFAVVHDLADGRIGGRRDLDQIQILFSSQIQGCLAGHDPQLGPVGSDHTELLVLNFFVELMRHFSDGKHLHKIQQKRMPTAPAQTPGTPPGRTV